MKKTFKTIVSIFFVSLMIGVAAFAAFGNIFFVDKKNSDENYFPLNDEVFPPEDNDFFLEDFTVHEWGVFYQKYGKDFSYVFNPDVEIDYVEPPDDDIRPLKPVIYFHSNNNLSMVTVEVDICDDLVTIPNATVVDDKIRWTFTLEDNKVVLENGNIFDYLFYEGKIDSSQPLKAFVLKNDSSVSFFIKNTGDYCLSNIFFNYCSSKRRPFVITPYEDLGEDRAEFQGMSLEDYEYSNPGEEPIISTVESGFPNQPIEPIIEPLPERPIFRNSEIVRNHVFIESLAPGESVFITKPVGYNTQCFNYSLIRDVLNDTDLTSREIDDLMDYWDDIWFEPQMIFDEKNKKWNHKVFPDKDSAQILYMIPEKEYDRLLPIKVSPNPEFMKRIGLFYITDIPVKTCLSQKDAMDIVLTDVLDGNLEEKKVYYSTEIIRPNIKLCNFPSNKCVSPDDYSWFFFIDDYPTYNWSHPCRYVFVELDGSITVFDNSWWPNNFEKLEVFEPMDKSGFSFRDNLQ